MPEVNPMRFTTIFLLMMLTVHAAQQKDTRAEAQLQAAINKETVDGDLKGAIEQYRRLAQSGNRAVAGKALVRMGQCHEKLGSKEARQAYERAIRDFAYQPEVVTAAKARLAAIGAPADTGVSARLLYSYPNGGPERRYTLDGRLSVFSDGSSVNVQDSATTAAKRISESGNAEFLALSRDGKRVAFCSWIQHPQTKSWDSELRVARLDGSDSRAIPYGPKPVSMAGPTDWSPDGKYILAARWPGVGAASDMVLIAADTGEITVVGKTASRLNGRFSPDGQFIAFDGREDATAGPKDVRDIYVMRADGTGEAAIVKSPANDHNPFWSPDGSHILFLSDRSGSSSLWSIRFENGKASGEPQLVQHNFPGVITDIANDGTVYYTARSSVGDVFAAGLDPDTGKLTGPPQRQSEVGINRAPVWSPDGNTLAFLTNCAAGNSFRDRPDIVLRPASGAPQVIKNKFHGSCIMNPLAWFPDGRTMLVRQTPQLHALDLGTGASKPVFPGFDARSHGALSPDGKSLYHFGWDMTGGIYRRDEAGKAAIIIPSSAYSAGAKATSLSLSADGQQLAMLESGRLRVATTTGGPFRDLFQPRTGITTLGPALRTLWSPDGKFIYFTATVNEKTPAIRLWRAPASGGEPQLVLELPGVTILAPAIHPGGRQIAFSTDQTRVEHWQLRNLLSQLR